MEKQEGRKSTKNLGAKPTTKNPIKNPKKSKQNRKHSVTKFLGYFMVFIVLAHGTIHIILFQTNIPIFDTVGISGNAIGDIKLNNELEEEIRMDSQTSKSSKLIIIAEWVFLLSIIVLAVLRKKIEFEQQSDNIKSLQKKRKDETDIDLLYELIQDHKKISVTKLSKLFNVDKEVIKKWGEVLENSELVTVDYPRFGDAKIMLREEDEKENKKTK
jgi:hypothetical protein